MNLFQCCENYIDSVNNEDTNGNEEIYNTCFDFINGNSTKKQDQILINFFKIK